MQRTGGIGGGVLVDFATVNGTAIGGLGEEDGDFKITSGTLSFGFGNTSATIIIPIRQDTQAEGNETFTVVLSNARTQVGSLVLPAVGKVATVTIVDDESAFQFSAPTFSVKEGTPNAVVTVLRTGTLTVPATVTYTRHAGHRAARNRLHARLRPPLVPGEHAEQDLQRADRQQHAAGRHAHRRCWPSARRPAAPSSARCARPP